MTITRFTQPDKDVFGRRFSDVLDEFFNDAVERRQDSFVPRIDVSETETAYSIEVQLPGMKKEDISISLENGMLTISGERKFKNEKSEKKFHRVETHYGSFRRSFQLPENIDPDSVQAKYNEGILEIRVAKSEEKMKKKIEVK